MTPALRRTSQVLQTYLHGPDPEEGGLLQPVTVHNTGVQTQQQHTRHKTEHGDSFNETNHTVRTGSEHQNPAKGSAASGPTDRTNHDGGL